MINVHVGGIYELTDGSQIMIIGTQNDKNHGELYYSFKFTLVNMWGAAWDKSGNGINGTMNIIKAVV